MCSSPTSPLPSPPTTPQARHALDVTGAERDAMREAAAHEGAAASAAVAQLLAARTELAQHKARFNKNTRSRRQYISKAPTTVTQLLAARAELAQHKRAF